MTDLHVHSPADAEMNASSLEKLKNAIQQDIDHDRMFGAAMIVARKGKIVLREVFGAAAPGRPSRLDDLYMMMSVTKSYTALLVLRAIEQGLFQLDTRISEILPDFGQAGKGAITVFHILTHQAGLFALPIPPKPLAPTDIGDLDKMFGAVAALPAEFPAGTKASYSSFAAFAVLGRLLEVTDRKRRSFTQIAHDELFSPLGMIDSQIGGTKDNPRRVPVSHTEKMKQADSTLANASVVENFLNFQASPGVQVPSANAYGTVDDLFRFAETLRLGGTSNNGYRLISPALLHYATKNHCGDMPNAIFIPECDALHMAHLRANFGLHGGYVRGEGHLLNVAGYTASPQAFSGMGGGSTMWMVDPVLELTTVFLSAGFIEGLAHLIRLAKLNDLAISACD